MPHRDDFDDDLMDPSSDAYDYKPVSSHEGSGGKAAKLFVAVTLIAAVAGAAWYFVGAGSSNNEDIPLVRADTGPTKEKPSDPGGMDVPNRDKTVYERLSGDNTEPKLERLLPRPEKPLEKPAAGMDIPELSETVSKTTGMPAISKELPPAPVEEKKVEQPTEPQMPSSTPQPVAKLPEVPTEEMAEKITPPPPAPLVDQNAPRALTKRSETPAGPDEKDKEDLAAKIAEALNAPDEKTSPQATPPVSQPQKMAKTVNPIKPLATAGYVLQLMSSKNEAGVKSAWEKIKAKNADLIKGLPGSIVKADLGNKGIYYRLRLGPVQTSDKAKAVCNSLKERKVGCFIVRVQ